jgi:hypothetical protein
MKTLLSLTLLLSSIATIAQSSLYGTLKSGMTKNQVILACKSAPFTTSSSKQVSTKIGNKTFYLTTLFTETGKLMEVDLICADKVEKSGNYVPKLQEIYRTYIDLVTEKYDDIDFVNDPDYESMAPGDIFHFIRWSSDELIALNNVHLEENYFLVEIRIKDLSIKNTGNF